jgi:hypothetical protein
MSAAPVGTVAFVRDECHRNQQFTGAISLESVRSVARLCLAWLLWLMANFTMAHTTVSRGAQVPA